MEGKKFADFTIVYQTMECSIYTILYIHDVGKLEIEGKKYVYDIHVYYRYINTHTYRHK